ncbi:proline-rich protein 36-like, partial [Homarus americanus]|uniref:proline-rich protein 36-like n=1 Tax=Homarus americanus TaxID=6706 RepID=UPI001C43C8E9
MRSTGLPTNQTFPAPLACVPPPAWPTAAPVSPHLPGPQLHVSPHLSGLLAHTCVPHLLALTVSPTYLAPTVSPLGPNCVPHLLGSNCSPTYLAGCPPPGHCCPPTWPLTCPLLGHNCPPPSLAPNCVPHLLNCPPPWPTCVSPSPYCVPSWPTCPLWPQLSPPYLAQYVSPTCQLAVPPPAWAVRVPPPAWPAGQPVSSPPAGPQLLRFLICLACWPTPVSSTYLARLYGSHLPGLLATPVSSTWPAAVWVPLICLACSAACVLHLPAAMRFLICLAAGQPVSSYCQLYGSPICLACWPTPVSTYLARSCTVPLICRLLAKRLCPPPTWPCTRFPHLPGLPCLCPPPGPSCTSPHLACWRTPPPPPLGSPACPAPTLCPPPAAAVPSSAWPAGQRLCPPPTWPQLYGSLICLACWPTPVSSYCPAAAGSPHLPAAGQPVSSTYLAGAVPSSAVLCCCVPPYLARLLVPYAWPAGQRLCPPPTCAAVRFPSSAWPAGHKCVPHLPCPSLYGSPHLPGLLANACVLHLPGPQLHVPHLPGLLANNCVPTYLARSCMVSSALACWPMPVSSTYLARSSTRSPHLPGLLANNCVLTTCRAVRFPICLACWPTPVSSTYLARAAVRFPHLPGLLANKCALTYLARSHVPHLPVACWPTPVSSTYLARSCTVPHLPGLLATCPPPTWLQLYGSPSAWPAGQRLCPPPTWPAELHGPHLPGLLANACVLHLPGPQLYGGSPHLPGLLANACVLHLARAAVRFPSSAWPAGYACVLHLPGPQLYGSPHLPGLLAQRLCPPPTWPAAVRFLICLACWPTPVSHLPGLQLYGFPICLACWPTPVSSTYLARSCTVPPSAWPAGQRLCPPPTWPWQPTVPHLPGLLANACVLHLPGPQLYGSSSAWPAGQRLCPPPTWPAACKRMHLDRTNSKEAYQMSQQDEESALIKTKCEKDLDVYVVNELKFSGHCEKKVVNQAMKL